MQSTKSKQPTASQVSEKEYNKALDNYNSAFQELASAALELDEQIKALKTESDKATAKARKKKEDAELVIQTYFGQNRESLLGDKQSIKTAIGTIGYRSGSAVKLPDDTDTKTLVDQFKKKGLELYIATKEDIDKSAIKKAIDENSADGKKLAKLGITIETSETFYIKP